MTKVKEKRDTKTKEEQQLIYCGPNIGLKLSKNTVYVGGIPKTIEKEIKECEEIKKLFVPIAKYVETKEKITEDGTIENLLYRTVESYLRKED